MPGVARRSGAPRSSREFVESYVTIDQLAALRLAGVCFEFCLELAKSSIALIERHTSELPFGTMCQALQNPRKASNWGAWKAAFGRLNNPPHCRKGDTAAIGLSEGVRTRARSVSIRVANLQRSRHRNWRGRLRRRRELDVVRRERHNADLSAVSHRTDALAVVLNAKTASVPCG